LRRCIVAKSGPTLNFTCKFARPIALARRQRILAPGVVDAGVVGQEMFTQPRLQTDRCLLSGQSAQTTGE